jgi:tRNA threonylcarbamoyladenosine biosynthesis protein TsaE
VGDIPNVETEHLTLTTHSPVETQELGVVLGRLLEGHELICLEGELGTGKTTLIQAIGRAQGVASPITSPTFTLVNEYQGQKGKLYHVDLYRLDTLEEIIQAGIDSYLYGEGIRLFEWAEKVRHILPEEYLYLTLTHSGHDQRRIALKAKGGSCSLLLGHLREALESQS